MSATLLTKQLSGHLASECFSSFPFSLPVDFLSALSLPFSFSVFFILRGPSWVSFYHSDNGITRSILIQHILKLHVSWPHPYTYIYSGRIFVFRRRRFSLNVYLLRWTYVKMIWNTQAVYKVIGVCQKSISDDLVSTTETGGK